MKIVIRILHDRYILVDEQLVSTSRHASYLQIVEISVNVIDSTAKIQSVEDGENIENDIVIRREEKPAEKHSARTRRKMK